MITAHLPTDDEPDKPEEYPPFQTCFLKTRSAFSSVVCVVTAAWFW